MPVEQRPALPLAKRRASLRHIETRDKVRGVATDEHLKQLFEDG